MNVLDAMEYGQYPIQLISNNLRLTLNKDLSSLLTNTTVTFPYYVKSSMSNVSLITNNETGLTLTNFNGIFIDGLKANMILDKNGVNFASLVTTSTNSNEKKEENSNSKPWILNFSDIKANIDYDLEDKINNNSIEAKSILLDAQNLKIVNSLVELEKANVANKTFQFLDKSNNLEIKSNNINI